MSEIGDGRTDGDTLSATQVEELDRACDQFEEALRAGGGLRIEDCLSEAEGPVLSALLGELIAIEVDWRHRLGERPEAAEYRKRFPGHVDAVSAAFTRATDRPSTTKPSPLAAGATPVEQASGVLLALLAFQNNFIDRGSLRAALDGCGDPHATPPGQFLVERGALDAETHDLLQRLVKKHLDAHGGDLEKSLAALAPGRSRRRARARTVERENPTTEQRGGVTPAGAEHDAGPRGARSASAAGQRFRVVRPHARGGLGEVFVAIDSQLNREVALKQILKQNADDPVSRQRFLNEAEITGGLEHPGIVPVYGLGSYRDGRPYYAMRFIRGDSLKQAIDRFHGEPGRVGAGSPAGKARGTDAPSLAFRKLLRRFLDVCNAIDYAHSRGVLHRDIKPANIILGKHGETLMVDWGLAKATGKGEPGSDERTLSPSSGSGSAETLPGSVLGTPTYMSPEQAEADLSSLGPACDVYSLGATLYCLLTGRAPFVGDRADAVLEKVRRGEFPKPRTLRPEVAVPLQAICLKAMALQPADRYATPRALADDVERWLADEPVEAWREPFSIRAGRWMRRHRTLIAATAASAPLLVAGVVLSGVLVVRAILAEGRARLERDRALAAEVRTALERDHALAAEAKAKVEADKATAINAFMTEDLLTQAEPASNAVEDHVTLLEVLDRAANKVGQRFADEPELEAALRETIASTYHGLAAWTKAEAQWRAVLAAARRRNPGSAETFRAMGELSHILRHRGRLDAEVFQQAEQGADGLARTLGPEHPDTLEAMNNLSLAYLDARRLNEAISLWENILKFQKASRRRYQLETLATMNNLATAYLHAGRLRDALPMLEEALKVSKANFGPEHADTLSTMTSLASAYQDAGRIDDAILLLQEALKLEKAKFGPDHDETLYSTNLLALCYEDAGRLNEAAPLLEETLKLRKSKLGPDHLATLISMNNLAGAYRSLGRLREAVSLYEETVKLEKAKLGPDHPERLKTLNNLAGAYLDMKKWIDAENIARDCLDHRVKKLPDEWTRFHTMSQLGASLAGQKKYGEAEPHLVQGYEGLKAREAKIPGSGRKPLAAAASRIVPFYESWGKTDKANEWKSKLGLRDLPASVFAQP